MAKRKVTKTEIYTQYDENGEENRSIKNETYQVESEPDYVKLYIQDIGRLKNFTSAQNKILLAFMRYVGYKNVIPAYKPIKMLIAKELNISIETVNKAVTEFKKKGIFIPIARGIYIADPELFGRGKWADIKNLRLIIDYNSNGTKTISSSIGDQLKIDLGI